MVLHILLYIVHKKISLKPIFKAEEAIIKAFFVQFTKKFNSTGMQQQLTVNQVYKLTELHSINQ